MSPLGPLSAESGGWHLAPMSDKRMAMVCEIGTIASTVCLAMEADMSEFSSQVYDLGLYDPTDERSIEKYAQKLEGMTFNEVLDLGIYSPKAREKEQAGKGYRERAYKGGLGNLLEERYFAYDANSDMEPDFAEAGVEAKTTCCDMKKDGTLTAGERLSIDMVPYGDEAMLDFDSSLFWAKARRILLVVYQRNRSLENRYDQRLRYAILFTPPAKDLAIIRRDYETIMNFVRAGRADELSEGMTMYLGAATKGANAERSTVIQKYPVTSEDGGLEYRPARKRAFSFKQSYMREVLSEYVIPRREAAHKPDYSFSANPAFIKLLRKSDIGDAGQNTILLKEPLGEGETFESRIEAMVSRYLGRSDKELGEMFDLKAGKAFWVSIGKAILGIKNNNAEEFVKAGVDLRVVRIQRSGSIRESLSLDTFEFEDLCAERDWEDSALCCQLEETRFLFVVFRENETGKGYHLSGLKFWAMPCTDVERWARLCWEQTKRVLDEGVQLIEKRDKNDKPSYSNNLPKKGDNEVVHVRPHANKSAYLFEDGTVRGNIYKDGSKLPDGRYMTKQSFWINNDYLAKVLAD